MSTKPPRRGFRTCPGCGRNRAERFFTGTRVDSKCATCKKRRTRHVSRDVRLMETYGITEDDYKRMLEAQGGKCAILGTTPRGRQHLDVDHDHSVERELLAAGWEPQAAARASVRGLLSRNANRRLLPAAKDDPVNLQNAIDYLLDPPAKQVLTTSENVQCL